MDTERCKEFVVLAQTRNFLEASNQLFIAQSSLSKHIKSLEKELGVTLFNRSTRHVELSPAGKLFLPYAKKIAHLDYELRRAIFNSSENEREVLDIGSIPVMAPYGITQLLARFEQDNISERLRLVEGDADELKRLLLKHKLELAFIRESGSGVGDGDREEFSTVPFTDDHLVAVLPRSHPLADTGRIRLGDLDGEEFLLLPKGTVMYSLIADACAAEGFVPQVRYQGSRAENILDLVSRGMGVSLLMRKPVLYLARDDVSIVDVDPTVTTRVKVYFRRDGELSPAAQKFLAYLPIYGDDAASRR
ncbi:LysR family transcriptional regulator [Actinomyces glycerinitolerans]|uniref:Transcription regulator hth lysr n=1 Tax=Actinomyces glycerinitolerans TaxID=1892869 RepID=A0A1M4RXT3_9ACTO|nr:LysR family transcriptional regulator [Actinomyces glycerinitolerans]SHE24805.1 transcription regulator hth lysr [Actinomyces glycerinitolerans]